MEVTCSGTATANPTSNEIVLSNEVVDRRRTTTYLKENKKHLKVCCALISRLTSTTPKCQHYYYIVVSSHSSRCIKSMTAAELPCTSLMQGTFPTTRGSNVVHARQLFPRIHALSPHACLFSHRRRELAISLLSNRCTADGSSGKALIMCCASASLCRAMLSGLICGLLVVLLLLLLLPLVGRRSGRASPLRAGFELMLLVDGLPSMGRTSAADSGCSQALRTKCRSPLERRGRQGSLRERTACSSVRVQEVACKRVMHPKRGLCMCE